MDGRGGDVEKVQEVELVGVRAEFREALREEIDAATRAASAAGVALVNGRKVGRAGEAFQYAFSVENALSVPDDAPGDLYVPALGRRFDAVVMSVQGLAVRVSVNQDLGDFVAQAKLTSNLAHLMRRLIERIEDSRDEPNAGGDRLLGHTPRAGAPAASVRAKTERLNARQIEAIASSIGRDTTFIWGPPGTGKTSTIGGIGEALYREGRSLLLVSHTNTAVDQALLRIADVLDDDLREGSVLRVGEPKDLRLAKRDDLLLKAQVERRSRELVERRDERHGERDALLPRIRELRRLLDVLEWLPEAAAAAADWRRQLADLDALEQRAEVAQRRAGKLRAQEAEQQRLRGAAGLARSVELDVAEAERALPGAWEAAQGAQERAAQARAGVETAEQALMTSRRLEPLRERQARLPGLQAAHQTTAELQAATGTLDASKQHARIACDDARTLLDQTQGASALTRRFRGLPQPEEQQQALADREEELAAVGAEHLRLRALAYEAAEVLAEVERLAGELDPHRDVGDLAACERVLAAKNASAEVAEVATREAADRVSDFQRTIRVGAARVAAFREEHGDPTDMILAFDAYKKQLVDATQAFMTLGREVAQRRSELTEALKAPAAAVAEWGLAAAPRDATAEAALATVEAAIVAGRVLAEAHDLAQLRDELTPLQMRLSEIERELVEIAEALERIEDTVIAEATIIATTLTRAYLRDSIHGRRFDTVVLDEASMAPIPALWVAASLADEGVVVVGDPMQLPPIAIAADGDEHKAATKWLGRDIFEAGGLQRGTGEQLPEYVVRLDTQYRMHPEISAIVNNLAYDGDLRDGAGTADESGLEGWYRRDWGHDAPVLMVDTGPVDAWCSTIDAGGRTSRINFLSATIAADLAAQLLEDDRSGHVPGNEPRIIIATPYRPQARLLELLLRERGLEGEVVAGTAHSFQGSEAPIVIFDTVVDEPHWKVNLFIPALDEGNKRLLNVALSRAKRRLIFVGDVEYIRKTGKNAVLGRLVERLLEHRTPRVSALDTVVAGLAARAAQSASVVFGEVAAADADSVVLTQDEYFRHLNADLDAAKSRCVLYSPFLTRNALARAEPHLRAAVERGVDVYVITKAHGDRGKRELPNIRELEDALTRWGVIVIHKRRMHEKIVLIDGEIVWCGSLNTLSFSDTQEIMLRFRSQALHDDLSRALRLDDVVCVYEPTADDGRAGCPICEWPLDAAEGGRGPFLSCPNPDCSYTRNLDAPPPRNGMIVCANCGAAIEYHETDKRGAQWRCTANNRHWQRIARTHLTLPRMVELLTRAQLRTVCKDLNLNYDDVRRRAQAALEARSNAAAPRREPPPARPLF